MLITIIKRTDFFCVSWINEFFSPSIHQCTQATHTGENESFSHRHRKFSCYLPFLILGILVYWNWWFTFDMKLLLFSILFVKVSFVPKINKLLILVKLNKRLTVNGYWTVNGWDTIKFLIMCWNVLSGITIMLRLSIS